MAARTVSTALSAGTSSGGGYVYLLGTDGLGRDIVSTILYGLRISLVVAVTSTAVAALIGAYAPDRVGSKPVPSLVVTRPPTEIFAELLVTTSR